MRFFSFFAVACVSRVGGLFIGAPRTHSASIDVFMSSAPTDDECIVNAENAAEQAACMDAFVAWGSAEWLTAPAPRDEESPAEASIQSNGINIPAPKDGADECIANFENAAEQAACMDAFVAWGSGR